jgi:hypothetical protein
MSPSAPSSPVAEPVADESHSASSSPHLAEQAPAEPKAEEITSEAEPAGSAEAEDSAEATESAGTAEATETTDTIEATDATHSTDAAGPTKPSEPSPPPDLDALIAELRASLASSQTLLTTQATRLAKLTDVETELAQLKDQYAFLAAAKDAVQTQLQEETKRREMAEENVELLRGQVEQARRGVGILQKQEQERKRLSLLPSSGAGLGLMGTGDLEEVLADSGGKETVGTTRANKRASMLVGRAQRRTSAQSEAGDGLSLGAGPSMPSAVSPNPNAPRAGGLRELRLGSGTTTITGHTATSPAPTSTIFFEDSTPHPVPPSLTHRSSLTPSSGQPFTGDNIPTPLSPANTEEARLRAELAAVRAQLAEAEESREASEACLKALREFMAAGGSEGGAAEEDLLKTIRLPPLPTDKDADESHLLPTDSAKKGGWGFKLWKQGPASPASTTVEPPATPAPTGGFSPAGSVRGTMTPKVSPSPSPGELPTEGLIHALPASSTPLGSIVSGWTKGVMSASSTTEASSDQPKPAAYRSLSSLFSRRKEDVSPAKEKELPPHPQEQEEDGGDKVDGAESLSPEAPEKQAETNEQSEERGKVINQAEQGEEVREVEEARVEVPESGLREISLNEPEDEHKGN